MFTDNGSVGAHTSFSFQVPSNTAQPSPSLLFDPSHVSRLVNGPHSNARPRPDIRPCRHFEWRANPGHLSSIVTTACTDQLHITHKLIESVENEEEANGDEQERVSYLTPDDHRQLYLASAACPNWTVYERCYTYRTRMSVLVWPKGHHHEGLNTDRLMMQWIVNLQTVLGQSYPPRLLWCLFHVNPDSSVRLHWPALAVRTQDLTVSWCQSIVSATDGGDVIESMYPVHLCDWIALPIPESVGLVSPSGGLFYQGQAPVLDALTTAECDVNWYVGYGDIVQINLVTEWDEWCGLQPLFNSVNPMGTPLQALEVQAPVVLGALMSQCHTDNAVQATITWLSRLLCSLRSSRTSDPYQQNEVGVLVYAVTHGHMAGYSLWVLWIHKWDSQVVDELPLPERCDLLYQWSAFTVNCGTTTAQQRLLALNQQDCTEHDREQYLFRERYANHADRPIKGPSATDDNNHIFAVLGSLNHMDLAKYVYHQKQGFIVCSKQVGSRAMGPGMWMVYSHEMHRWVMDPPGSIVMRACHEVLSSQLTELRNYHEYLMNYHEHHHHQGDGSSNNNQRSPSLLSVVNFPQDHNPLVLVKAIVCHLDHQIGDIRNLQHITRALALISTETGFCDRMDSVNHHLIPFANGVLDLRHCRLRGGKPEDMVMIGPTYPFPNITPTDPVMVEMEQLLTTLFPDRCLRSFWLKVAASLLHRRNKHKHFYVMTGNTNGGKSLLLNLLTMCLEGLACTLPLGAITSKEGDASSHTDYLARTQGMAIVVCNEPDVVSHMLYAERVKVLTSDVDKLPVREIYRSAREMVISWKLFMACNTPPRFVNIDCAVLERCVFIPFVSSFVEPLKAPKTEVQQFRKRTFPRRIFEADHLTSLSRALMVILVATYQKHQMYQSEYHLQVPRQIKRHTELQLADVSRFRSWVAAFVRPSLLIHGGCPTTRRADMVARQIALIVRDAAAKWKQSNNKHWARFSDLPQDVQQDVRTVGSPGWVRRQCLLQWRTLWRSSGPPPHPQGSELQYSIPLLDADAIGEAYAKFSRMASRGRNQTRTYNTAQSFDPSQHDEHGNGSGGGNNSGGRRQSKLDPGFVYHTIREITGNVNALIDNMYVGVVLIEDTGTRVCDNEHHTYNGNHALLHTIREWYQQYKAPLFHSALLHPDHIQHHLQRMVRDPPTQTPYGSTIKQHAYRTSELTEDIPGGNSADLATDVHTEKVVIEESDNAVHWDELIQNQNQAEAHMGLYEMHMYSLISQMDEKNRITQHDHWFSRDSTWTGGLPSGIPDEHQQSDILQRTMATLKFYCGPDHRCCTISYGNRPQGA